MRTADRLARFRLLGYVGLSLLTAVSGESQQTAIRNVTIVDPGGVALRATAGMVAVDGSRLSGGTTGLSVEGSASLSMRHTEVVGSAGDGVLIETDGSVTLRACDVHGHGAAGVRALRAAGGFFLRDQDGARPKVRNNAGHGVILGDLLMQSGPVIAEITSADIYGNEVGIVARQKDATTAWTETAVVFSIIRDNRGSGISLRSSYLRPHSLLAPVYSPAPRFAGNIVSHNAMETASCLSTQTAAQILVDGPVAVTAQESAACSAATTSSQCDEAAAAGAPCLFVGSGPSGQCLPSWRLNPLDPFCSTLPNTITDYNITTISDTAIGIRAIGQALVDARNNRWPSDFRRANAAAGSFVAHDTFCAPSGNCR